MDNFILISGPSLWALLGLIAVITVALIVLGVSYVKECRDKQYYHDKYRALCREHSILQLEALSSEVKVGNCIGNRSK